MSSRDESGYIGPGLRIRGAVGGEADLAVDGRIDGTVSITGALQIGPSGTIVARVTAVTVRVEGELRGDVQARDAVHVHAGGLIEGDVRARRIAIDDGGVLQGGVEMDFDAGGGA